MAEPVGAKPPRLSMRMLTLLAEANPTRGELDPRELSDESRVSQVAFTTTRERAVVALSMYVVQALARHGASRLDEDLIASMLDRLWPSMSHAERVEVEIEAYEMLEFIGTTLQPALARATNPPEHVSPDSSHEQVARWAIHHARDLRIEFYDRRAGQLIAHRITPMSLDASVYLRAISHTTREELVFSLKSAGVLEPVDGWTMHHEQSRAQDFWETPPERLMRDEQISDQMMHDDDSIPESKPARKQMSWLDEIPAPQEE